MPAARKPKSRARRPKSRHMTIVEGKLAIGLYRSGYKPAEIIQLLKLPHSPHAIKTMMNRRQIKRLRRKPTKRNVMHAAIVIYELAAEGLEIDISKLARIFGIDRGSIRTAANYARQVNPSVEIKKSTKAPKTKLQITPFIEKFLRRHGYLTGPIEQSGFVFVPERLAPRKAGVQEKLPDSAVRAIASAADLFERRLGQRRNLLLKIGRTAIGELLMTEPKASRTRIITIAREAMLRNR